MSGFTLIHRLRNKLRVDTGNMVSIGTGVTMSQCRVLIRGKGNRLIIGNGSTLRATTLEIIGEQCTLEIGPNCMIGHHCYLSAKEQGVRLTIGDDCGLSRHIKIMTSDGHPIFSQGMRINHAKDIVIGNHVWIGDQATILKGVTVGDGSVIGIGSIVTRSIPEAAVAAGNPARVVKEHVTWQP